MPVPLPDLSSSPLADPLAQARIPVLLLPVGRVRESIWNKWSQKIAHFKEVRLSDVPGTSGSASGKGDKARFLPPSHPPPQTHLHLSFSSTPMQRTLNHILPLSLLQVSAFPLAVIGIADLSDTSTTQSQKMDMFHDTLDSLGLSNADGLVFPLTRRCFGVEDEAVEALGSDSVSTPSGTEAAETSRRRVEESAQFKGMVEIDASDTKVARPPHSTHPSSSSIHGDTSSTKRTDRKSYEDRIVVIPKDTTGGMKFDLVLGMLIADVCASILTEFGEIAQAVESTAGGQMLASSMLPTLTTRAAPRTDLVSGLVRPRSTQGSNPSLAVINTSGITNTRTPSPLPRDRPQSVAGYSVPGTDTNDLDPTRRALGNTPPPGRPDAKAMATSIKRSSTGFSLSKSVASNGRVSSGANTLEVINTTNPRSLNTSTTSNTNTPAAPSGSTTGRLKKVQADLWLLSGRLGEAMSLYTEATQSLKNANDYLWQASATEGLAVATWLEAWESRDPISESGGNGTGGVPFHSSPTATLVHDLYNQAIALYGRCSAPPDSLFMHGSESGETVIARLYTACALRHARFLLAIWSAGGFGSPALEAAVRNDSSMPRIYPPPDYQYRRRVFMKLSTLSHVARVSVSTIANRAHGPWILRLPTDVQLQVLVALAGVHRVLGLERREAVLTREVVGLVVAMIAKTRIKASRLDAPIFGGRSNTAASLDTNIVVNDGLGLASAVSTTSGSITTMQRETEDGNRAVMELVSRMLDIFGLDLCSLGPRPPVKTLIRYGWPELQVAMLREAVAAAETLPDYNSIVGFATSALRTLHENLAPQAQQLLLSAYSRAMSIARRRNIPMKVSTRWIPDEVVAGLEFSPLAPEKVPYEIKARGSLETIRHGQTKDVFLYNPRAKTLANGEPVYVAKDTIEVVVTLNNPFGIDLEVQNMTLSTQGVKFTSQPIAFVLPPSSTHRICIQGVAHEPGSLVVNGCILRLGDGTDYLIPLPENSIKVPSGTKRDRKRTNKAPRKLVGLDARPSQVVSGDVMDEDKTSISCNILGEQPTLLIRRTSLNHGSVILHEGEQTVIQLTLENTASSQVDFVNMSFEDNLDSRAAALLEEGTLSETETFELEQDTLDRPVMQWTPPEEGVSVAPGQRQSLRIKCRGKVGCVSGAIKIDYGHLPEDEHTTITRPTIYSRRLILPVLFTVQPALRCTSLRVMPFSHKTASSTTEKGTSPAEHVMKPLTTHDSGFRRNREEEERFQSFLNRAADDEQYTGTQMTMFNPSDYALECMVQCKDIESGEGMMVRRLVAPGATERFIFPIGLPKLSASELEQDVPRLGNRQFVVDRSGRKEADVLAERRQFWSRQALLQNVKAWWGIPGSDRTGEVSLLTVRIPASDLEALQVDRIMVSLAVYDLEGQQVDIVSANTPVMLLAFVSINRGEDDVGEYKYAFEPILETSLASTVIGSSARPSRKELEFLARVIAFSGPASGLVSFPSPNADATMEGKASAAVCFFADGVYRFRVLVRASRDGEEWEAHCHIRVQG
ncbi:hypothetical protein NliqN6_4947 [Naganishia liquefaciens]|uniref:Uncharacterized protein n=1 Tax=Naganishia liquefaciens TaxID=104408 RepID=A0A8H3TXB2_9TREE|nr:hypothetical protein NliqN6_4947 [Naganishia liquefaciens]